MKQFILKSIEKAFNNKDIQSEMDRQAVQENLDKDDIIQALKSIEYFESPLYFDVEQDLIKYIHEELRELEFPDDLNGFDYEIKKGIAALIQFLEEKQRTDLETEILENLKQSNSFADVDCFILENRVEKYKSEIIEKIKAELKK